MSEYTMYTQIYTMYFQNLNIVDSNFYRFIDSEWSDECVDFIMFFCMISCQKKNNSIFKNGSDFEYEIGSPLYFKEVKLKIPSTTYFYSWKKTTTNLGKTWIFTQI
jgi:hypothetical protein